MIVEDFVLAILFIVIGLPIICGTIVKIIHGPKDKKKKGKGKDNVGDQDKNQEILEEIFYGLKDLGKRVNNLETILDAKEKGEKYE